MDAFPVPSVDVGSSGEPVLHAAVSAYLGHYRGQTRLHAESDLRILPIGAVTS
jgi:integrase/recombinase XerD